MHGEHLVVDGRPMSKSLGNILYPGDIFNHGCSARDLRLFLFHTHYRKKLNFTKKRFQESCGRMAFLHEHALRLLRAGRRESGGSTRVKELIRRLPAAFEKEMDNDLSAGAAYDSVFSAIMELNKNSAQMTRKDAADLKFALTRIDAVLGVIL
jgi:cysteinyl-tRNA synthetase